MARASQPVFASDLGPIATKIEEEMVAFGVEHGAGTANKWKESAGGKELLYGGQGKCLEDEQVDGERDGARKQRHGDISTGIGTEPLYLSGEPASTGKLSCIFPGNSRRIPRFYPKNSILLQTCLPDPFYPKIPRVSHGA